MLTLETFTPSAEAALNEYEPIFWLDVFLATFCVPSAVFCVTVKLELESDKLLPFAAPELPVWLEVNPCKLVVLPVNAATRDVKLAVDCMSALSERTRVVFAGTMYLT